MIIDTRRMKREGKGRPNSTRIAWELYESEEAESVFVISNPKVTRKVVYGLESRGVPVFVAIWDSRAEGLRAGTIVFSDVRLYGFYGSTIVYE